MKKADRLSSYQKYRPKDFSEIVGQEFVKRALKNQIKEGKVSHAYLFSGPRGVGKTTVARILAKAVNCENPKDGEPCRVCESCKTIENGKALDILELDAASNRGIDKIRELIETISFIPSHLKKKVYIIDEAHQLTKEAVSALLKTLEEPPDFILFILATTDPQKILPTIISRCQHFSFKRYSDEEVFSQLKKVATLEKVEFEDSALKIISKSSDGCMRDALSIFDQISSFSQGRITKNLTLEILGILPFEKFESLFLDILFGETSALEKFYALYEEGISSDVILENLIDVARSSLLFKKSPNFRFERIDGEIYEIAEKTKEIDEKRIFEVYELILESKKYFNITDNPLVPVEIFILKAIKSAKGLADKTVIQSSHKKGSVSFDKQASEIVSLKDGTFGEKEISYEDESLDSERLVDQEISGEGTGNIPIDKPENSKNPINEESFSKIVSIVSEKKPILGSVLRNARKVSILDHTIFVYLANEIMMKIATNFENTRIINESVYESLGERVNIFFKVYSENTSIQDGSTSLEEKSRFERGKIYEGEDLKRAAEEILLGRMD